MTRATERFEAEFLRRLGKLWHARWAPRLGELERELLELQAKNTELEARQLHLSELERELLDLRTKSAELEAGLSRLGELERELRDLQAENAGLKAAQSRLGEHELPDPEAEGAGTAPRAESTAEVAPEVAEQAPYEPTHEDDEFWSRLRKVADERAEERQRRHEAAMLEIENAKLIRQKERQRRLAAFLESLRDALEKL